MRKIKIFYLLIVLVIVLFSPTNIAFANSVQILVDQLNVRKGPGTDYESISRVHANEQYPVIQQQGDWVEIQLDDNTTGWVTAEYISYEDQINDDQNESVSVTNITIPTDNLHVRSGPSIDQDILFFTRKGMNFEVISEVDDWYEIKHEEQSGFIHKDLLKVNHTFEKDLLKDKVFVIDAGHGGYDVGAIGVNGSYEKDIALKTTMELKNALENLGANVSLTRTNDEYIRLGGRTSIANLKNPDAFISIHYNSFPELPSATGIVSYYYDENDELLANHMQQELIHITEAHDRGTLHGDYQVLRHNLNQAVLLELGFISNDQKEQLLLTNDYQKQLIKGIVNGLIKYYGTK